MSIKKIITFLLSAFVLASVGYLVFTQLNKKDTIATDQGIDSSIKNNHTVVYYFHTNYRCYSCKRIEELTGSTIEKTFAKELESGLLIWRPVNIDKAENEHYIKDFDLYTKSVIVENKNKSKKTEWKLLDKTWNYLRDETGFRKYIREEVQAYIQLNGEA
ncbi:MAG: hypothetical protein GY754_41890 [bacterium]|nr:hypothetical protein [bacterium]